MKKLTVVFILVVFAFNSFSQNDSIIPPDYRRNIIKWNPTPFVLWSAKDINFSYERILKPYRSFSLNAGYFVLPSSGIYDSLNIKAARRNWGFTVSGDYRYYFKKRNKNFAPDGLFWGPFGSFHYTGFENDIEVLNSDLAQGTLNLRADVAILSAGVELGYQFVIKEKFTIDLIFMGPSFSVYSGKISLGGNLALDENDEYLKAIRDILIEKYPFLPELVNIGEFNSSGVSTSFGFGMRYMVQLGYRF
jgi:hypothetical protein